MADPRATGEASIQVLPRILAQPASARCDLNATLSFDLTLAPGVEVQARMVEGDRGGTALLAGPTQVRYSAPAGQDDGPSDLNGDGSVDDQDVQLALAAFEAPPATAIPARSQP